MSNKKHDRNNQILDKDLVLYNLKTKAREIKSEYAFKEALYALMDFVYAGKPQLSY